MPSKPTEVTSVLVRGLVNQLGMEDLDQLVRNQFPDIDRNTLWESYNIALVAFAGGAMHKPITSDRVGSLARHCPMY